jgi:hypothetical protein
VNAHPARRKLESDVRQAAQAEGVTERRMRRWISVIAFVEVFKIANARGEVPAFLIKGGFAIEFRFRSKARSSRDVDIVLSAARDDLVDTAVTVLRTEWSGFTFRMKSAPEPRDHAVRFSVNALYLGKEWSTFEVDLFEGPVDDTDAISPFDLAAFGLGSPTPIPCLNVSEQIAQKLHAVSDPDDDRPRDLVDIVLLDTYMTPNDDALREAVQRVFEERRRHPWPPNIEMRRTWPSALEEIIEQNNLGLTATATVAAVQRLVRRLSGA